MTPGEKQKARDAKKAEDKTLHIRKAQARAVWADMGFVPPEALYVGPFMPPHPRAGQWERERKSRENAMRQSWEPWEIGPKIYLDNCRAGVIVIP